MINLSYMLNILILFPVLFGLILRPDAMIPAFGGDTDARRILTCLYATIALASFAGLSLMLLGQTALATQLGVTLFALQIVYKLLTFPIVGLQSPVVITNLLVVAVHTVTLLTIWMSRPLA